MEAFFGFLLRLHPRGALPFTKTEEKEQAEAYKTSFPSALMLLLRHCQIEPVILYQRPADGIMSAFSRLESATGWRRRAAKVTKAYVCHVL